MSSRMIKKLFLYILLFVPLSFGIFSCGNDQKRISDSNKNLTTDLIPKIKAVAALGQLSPSGEIRQLAAPISQFGSSPRLTELLVNEGDFVKKGTILATFENREKLLGDLKKIVSLLSIIDQEILLKQDQIQRYELALNKNAYSFVQLSQRKDELLKLEKQKVNLKKMIFVEL